MADHILDKGFTAQSALTQFKAVKTGSVDDSCTAVTGTTDVVIGIVQETATSDDATAGRVVNVRLLGISDAIAGAAISRWAPVKVTAAGKMVTASAGERQVGLATIAAGADGDRFTVLLTPGARVGIAGQQTSITALTDSSGGATGNNTIAAIPDPTDTPASADALRDDLVATVLPKIRDAIADLAAKQNEVLTALDNAGVTA